MKTPLPLGIGKGRISQGPKVRQWQQFLKAKGLYNGPIDGKFQAGTLAATKVFQKATGLQADGVVGNATLAASAPTNVARGAPRPAPPPQPAPTNVARGAPRPAPPVASVAQTPAISPTSVKGANAMDWYRAKQAPTDRTIPLPGGLPAERLPGSDYGVPLNPVHQAQSAGQAGALPVARGGIGQLAGSPPLSIQGGLGQLAGSPPMTMDEYQRMLAARGAAMTEDVPGQRSFSEADPADPVGGLFSVR